MSQLNKQTNKLQTHEKEFKSLKTFRERKKTEEDSWRRFTKLLVPKNY